MIPKVLLGLGVLVELGVLYGLGLYLGAIWALLVLVGILHHVGTVGKWCAAEGSVMSGIREGCDHGFQKF